METLVYDQFNRINHYHKSGQDFVGTIMHVNVKNNVQVKHDPAWKINLVFMFVDFKLGL